MSNLTEKRIDFEVKLNKELEKIFYVNRRVMTAQDWRRIFNELLMFIYDER